ncbi:hypothetical protein [Bacillus smithii]|uniref:hypothetical protein n=1 Tax=Bacillus smithii TaxID=1479 RepID=UPI0030C93357
MVMSEEAKKARREYMKKWREANKNHIREYNKRYRRENPDKVAAAQERYWAKKFKQAAENS